MTIPERPQCVVVLDTAELDSVILLGISPVGAIPAHMSDAAEFPPHLQRATRASTVVGRHQQRSRSSSSSPRRSPT
ncbi:hypothetical protein [Pseudonocardia oceani]|uniref:hypothetical protein n=1 Tax=Pseudonocardia oceani TaxID=2792013 RepID=UPI00226B0716|nr:hypothetical protein [Pseudonocardia oceani]